jgi:uncharacterized membrane protein
VRSLQPRPILNIFATTRGWLLILGFLFGIAYAVLMKPLHGPDEERHFYRVFLVSSGICTGQPAIPSEEKRYGERFDYLDRQFTWTRLAAGTTGRDLVKLIDPARLRPHPVVANYTPVNLYSCVPYLPAGILVRLGRSLTGSPVDLMYWGRVGNLLFYLLMVWWAMRILPGFQLPIAVIALMPMALCQGASLSADAVTFGISFVFAAYVLSLALSERRSPLSSREVFMLGAGAVIAGLCKANVGLVFLVLLLPAARFASRRTRWIVVFGCVALAYGTMAVWQYANRGSVEIFSALRAADGINVSENARLIAGDPALFLGAVGQSLHRMGAEYLEQFVGKLGGLDVRLPLWLPWAYLPLMLMVAMACRTGERLLGWQRLLLAAIFLLNVASVFAVVWTTETRHEWIVAEPAHGELYVRGIQGRYLIPFILLLLVAASGAPVVRRLRGRWLTVAALLLVAVVNAAALATVWDIYQSHASTLPNRFRMPVRMWFSHGAAAAPMLYEDRAVTSRSGQGSPIFLVRGGVRHLVSRWPYDVVRISDEELAAIPTGPPIDTPIHNGYEGQLVQQAGSTDGKVYVVRNGRKHWVWDGAWLALRGYKWPADVHSIPAADLAAMTAGYSLP